MSWEAAALGAGGLGTVIVAFLAAIAAGKKLVADIRGTPPEGENPASLADVLSAAKEATVAATEAKEAASRAENKIDAHLQSHADADVRGPRLGIVRNTRL